MKGKIYGEVCYVLYELVKSGICTWLTLRLDMVAAEERKMAERAKKNGQNAKKTTDSSEPKKSEKKEA